jgi:hypothetical protein
MLGNEMALMKFDVLLSAAGLPDSLSAARLLGRSHRGALLCDEGHPRNLSSRTIHGLLGREGRSHLDFLDEARKELTRGCRPLVSAVAGACGRRPKAAAYTSRARVGQRR